MKIERIVILSCLCFALITHMEAIFAVNVWVYNTTRFPLEISGVPGSSYGVCNWLAVKKGATISRGCFFQSPESHRLICIRPIQRQFAFQFGLQGQCNKKDKVRELKMTVSDGQGSFQILGQTNIRGCQFGDRGVWATFTVQNQNKLYGSLVSGYQNLYIYVGNNADISQYGKPSVSLQTNEFDQCQTLPST